MATRGESAATLEDEMTTRETAEVAICIWYDTTGEGGWIVSLDELDESYGANSSTTLDVFDDATSAERDGRREADDRGLAAYLVNGLGEHTRIHEPRCDHPRMGHPTDSDAGCCLECGAKCACTDDYRAAECPVHGER